MTKRRARPDPIDEVTLLDEISARHEAEDRAAAEADGAAQNDQAAALKPVRKKSAEEPEGGQKGELVTIDDKTVLAFRPKPETASESPVVRMMEIMERMTINPAVDAMKLGELFKINAQAIEIQAKRDFDAALLRAKANIPIIGKNKKTEHKGTSKGGKEYDLKAAYATWDAIREIVDPILLAEGIFLTHRLADGREPGSIRIIAELKGHGHREEAAFLDLPPEGSGSKNAVQARGSSISYGERYTACAALGIATREEDDDARGSGRPMTIGEPLSEEQLEKIIEHAAAVECPEGQLVDHLNNYGRPKGHPVASRIAELPASRFKDVMETLKLWESNRRAEAAAGQKR